MYGLGVGDLPVFVRVFGFGDVIAICQHHPYLPASTVSGEDCSDHSTHHCSTENPHEARSSALLQSGCGNTAIIFTSSNATSQRQKPKHMAHLFPDDVTLWLVYRCPYE